MRLVSTNEQGFTLIEIVIGFSLSALLLTSISFLFPVYVRTWLEGQSRIEVQQTARYAIDKMTRELRYAESVELENFALYPNKGTIKGVKPAAAPNLAPETFRYYIDATNHILYRQSINPSGSRQPVTGANVRNSSTVELYPVEGKMFEVFGSHTAIITFMAIDKVTGESHTVRTAVHVLPQFIR